MELKLSMLAKYSDEKIAEMTGINVRTIRDWRVMIEDFRLAGVELPLIDYEDKIENELQTRILVRYHGREQSKKESEKSLQAEFVKTLNTEYKEYVRTKYGIIDVLTSDTIYELKTSIANNSIQKPVGQVILYSTEFHNINKVIVARSIKVSDHIKKAVNELGIQLLEFA